MKKYFLLLGFLFMLSCQKNTKDDSKINDTIATSHNSKNSLDYVGVYKGTLPCADCEGLETKIAINENETYSVEIKYLGKGENVFVKKGTFSWNKEGNTIELKGDKYGPSFYFVGENSLTQLDIYGKKITGDLASNYILKKQTNSNQDIESKEVSGTTVNLNNRMEVTTTVEKVNPAIGKFSLAETKWRLVLLNGKLMDKMKKAYFLKLNSKDGKFSAYAGCNNIFGSYTMPSAYTLSFSEIGSTRMACPTMSLEVKFLTMLEKTNSYLLESETLTFFAKGKKTIAKFEAIK